MDLLTFKSQNTLPPGLNVALQALWHEAQGDWPTAHNLLQGQAGQPTDWVHAYLHRVEGDQANADYWYRRADQSRPNQSLAEEWAAIAAALLAASG